MKEIPLTQGVIALVDDDCFEWLNQFKWHAILRRKTWYAKRWRTEKGREFHIFMHRLIMSAPEGMEVDHRIHRTMEDKIVDNRRENLRICTRSENQRNKRAGKSCKSGLPGVHWCKTKKRWIARITESMETIQLGRVQIEIPLKRVVLGHFVNFDDSKAVRLEAEKEIYGAFAPNHTLALAAIASSVQ